MVLAQWEAGRILDITVSATITQITLAGTMAIYACDRWLENRTLAVTAARHRAPLWTVFLFSFLILGLLLQSVPGLDWQLVKWISILAVAGLCYLFITTGRLKGFPGFKESIGAFCFTFLVWGPIGRPDRPVILAFFTIGLSNFLWSSHQDMQRDKANGLFSLATHWPEENRALARLCAFVSCLGFGIFEGPGTPFFWVATLLLFWPQRTKWSVDWAFLPLLLILVMKI